MDWLMSLMRSNGVVFDVFVDNDIEIHVEKTTPTLTLRLCTNERTGFAADYLCNPLKSTIEQTRRTGRMPPPTSQTLLTYHKTPAMALQTRSSKRTHDSVEPESPLSVRTS